MYQYLPLEAGEIRILNLLPASSTSAKLCGAFIHVDLKNSPGIQYEAISYVWGDPVFIESLHVRAEPPTSGTRSGLVSKLKRLSIQREKSELKITPSLAAALRRFRLADRPRLLWADAVCINQKDDVEKGLQVALMGEIYRRSEGVLAWLGEKHPSPHFISEWNDDLRGLLARVVAPVVDSLDNDCWMDALRHRKKFVRSTIGVNGMREDLGDSLDLRKRFLKAGFYELCVNPWFTRVWIVQEALLAKHLTLFIGNTSMDWAQFEQIAVLLMAWKFIGLSPPRFGQVVRLSWLLVELKHHPLLTGDMPGLLPGEWCRYAMRLQHRGCSDDRDRIYAFLGLLSGNTILTEPDYKKSTFQVYMETTKAVLTAGNFEVLSLAGTWRRKYDFAHGRLTENGSCEREYLPSWVPDYRNKDDLTVTTWTPQFAEGQTFLRWTVSRDLSSSILSTDTGDPHCISITGQRVGRVQTFFPTGIVRFIQSGDIIPQYFNMRQVISKLVDSLRPFRQRYSSESDWKRAFATTIIGGQSGEVMRDSQTATLIREDGSIPDPLELWENYEAQALDDNGELHKSLCEEVERGNRSIPSREWMREIRGDPGKAHEYSYLLWRVLSLHSFFVTDDGQFGLAPFLGDGYSSQTDIVVLFNGISIPFILSSLKDGGFHLLGPCYCHAVDVEGGMEKGNFSINLKVPGTSRRIIDTIA